MNATANILLVDDEPRNLDVLESILNSPDYRLVRAQTADEALLALVDGEFAVIVLDIRMPGMSGLELANLVKQRKKTQHIPIIFLTAYYQEDKYVLEGYGVGAVDYLTKPVNASILKSKVAVFADLFRSTRALAEANRVLELEVTQRKQAEEALRQANAELEARVAQRTGDLARSEERLRRTVDFDEAVMANMGEGLYTVDTQGLVTSMNPAAEKLFGWSFEELRGRKMHDITHHHHPDGTSFPADECAGLQVLKQGKTLADHEDCFIRKDGTFFDVIYSSSPLRSADGIAGVVVVFRDVTERKRAEVKLRESEARLSAASRAKDDFLAALSHELRTPLNPVLLLASESAEDPSLPAAVRANFASIRSNVELEARLIDDLLDLTRITRGKLGLHLAEVDVHGALQSAIDTVRADIDRKRIDLTLALRAARHHTIGDQVRLQQIFWNLLKNAVKFTPDAGKIIVETSVHAEGSTLAISVIDTGIGMTTEEIERVFHAFSQGDHANGSGPHRFGGMGLGLAISRMLVELHSGAIHAASAGRGKGATFVVKLPLGRELARVTKPASAEPESESPTPSVHRAAPAFRRILLVEDHEPTRTALAQLLRRRQYEVVTASSIEEALARADEGNIDLLISDIGLPDGNGFDLMSRLRERHQLRGIALTGYGMEQDIARSRAVGFVAHLIKPVRVQSLESALAAVAGATATSEPAK